MKFRIRLTSAVLVWTMAACGLAQAQMATPATESTPAASVAPMPTSLVPETSQSSPAPVTQAERSQNEAEKDKTAPIVQAAPPPSPPTEFQQLINSSTGQTLPIFGSELFSAVPSTFSPVDNIPVTSDYVIGPGDELRLQVWGQNNENSSVTVDRTGMIYLPSIGPVHVAGIQFSQLRAFLISQLSRVYRNFDLNVNLGQLRSIQVFVVGEAKQPGSYAIGSLSTLLNALFASGGPLPQGSLRDIQVKRGSTTVTHFDLYDLLLHGDKSKDIRLESGDVIFIPKVGPQVAVLGSVTTPAIYELRTETTFDQVIALAGGRTNTAAGSSVRVERISEHKERSILNLDMAKPEDGSATTQDGDIVTISPVLNRYNNAVTLRGNVANAGRYAWVPGMRISDLIPNQDALVTRYYYDRTNQLSHNTSDYATPWVAGQLGAASGTAAQPGPTEQRGALTQNGGGASVSEALAVHSELFPAQTDVILQAPDIDWEYAVIERQNPTNLVTTLIPFNLGKAVLDKDPTQNLELQQGDIVTIFSKADIRVPSAQQTVFVRLEGEFVGAGVYSVQPGETLRQLIARAGGLTPNAYLYGSEFTRVSAQRLQKQRLLDYADSLDAQISSQTSSVVSSALTDRDAAVAQTNAEIAHTIVTRLRDAQPTGRIVFDLKPNNQGVEALPDLVLEDGDRFIVPRVPANVSVEGQVYSANAFLWEKGKRVKNYLQLAGGADRTADSHRMYLLRADGSVVSNRHGGFGEVRVYPGDTIIVPTAVQKAGVLRQAADIATILSGFGIAAAAIEVLK
jgi:polysaccharide biosynthesis/export protein